MVMGATSTRKKLTSPIQLLIEASKSLIFNTNINQFKAFMALERSLSLLPAQYYNMSCLLQLLRAYIPTPPN